ncbi:MAG: histidinol dehydrogenase [Chitinophagia bacterium]|nr:histidinol dehydrogenase [Chitinophagia bacterium]
MQIFQEPSFQQWTELVQRPVIDQAPLHKTVSKILQQVKMKGDVAVKSFSKKFDGFSPRKLLVTEKEIKDAERKISVELQQAILRAHQNITKFHTQQIEVTKKIETSEGVYCWRKSVPIQRVGFYIPGGSAPLFSTVLMLGIPAQIVGCKHIVLSTPAGKDGQIHPAILYAASLVGVKEIYKAGGAQAIAAMAYGTESIAKVDKIFGPGNQYVTAAKQLVQLDGMAIDMPAGPSEVCIIADDTAVPAFIAADLLAQAEHGPDSQVMLVTNNHKIIDETAKELHIQVTQLERKTIAEKALENSKSILLKETDSIIAFVNQYAPEHLIVASDEPQQFVDGIVNAGSVFIGNYTPESAGDYASGTNHTLPTNGFAKSYSGVSVDSFVKKITYQQISRNGISKLGNTIIIMAEAEGLDAHANAVKIRLNKI